MTKPLGFTLALFLLVTVAVAHCGLILEVHVLGFGCRARLVCRVLLCLTPRAIWARIGILTDCDWEKQAVGSVPLPGVSTSAPMRTASEKNILRLTSSLKVPLQRSRTHR